MIDLEVRFISIQPSFKKQNAAQICQSFATIHIKKDTSLVKVSHKKHFTQCWCAIYQEDEKETE